MGGDRACSWSVCTDVDPGRIQVCARWEEAKLGRGGLVYGSAQRVVLSCAAARVGRRVL